ncbi:MAG TPA: hypothetical protein VN939_00830, partial [Chthoniobacterales bacterium]|nr:hypothetical protein [Chthoniobacterales bacterium]
MQDSKPLTAQSSDEDEAQPDSHEAIPGSKDSANKTDGQNASRNNADATPLPQIDNNLSNQKRSNESESDTFPKPTFAAAQDEITPKVFGPTPVLDLVRPEPDRKIYVGLVRTNADGFTRLAYGSEIEHNGRRNFVPNMPLALHRSLALPTGIKRSGSSRELFDSVLKLLEERVLLHTKERSIVTFWSIGTWFLDFLPFLPSLVVTGPPSAADLLLRTLAAVCRRPVLLAEMSSAVLQALPLGDLMPTLLIREPHLTKRMAALLDASNQPGYLLPKGKDFQQCFCAKCIYVGEHVTSQLLPANSIHIHVDGENPRYLPAPPAGDVIQDFQNRLLTYRFVHHDGVANSAFTFPRFRPQTRAIAKVFAAIVDDPDLKASVTGLLKDHDAQSRVDCATGQNAIVLRAVLWHCHEPDQQQAFVREIAATANRIYGEEGESLKISNETVGHVLRNLGLYTRRLGNAGKGLILDKATQNRVHELGYSNEVLPEGDGLPGCGYCHKLQLLET